MISRVHSFVLQGIDAIGCEIEVDLSPVGLPKTTVVGLPDVAVKESSERVRTALLNSGYRFPQTRVTVNLAPADVKKEGPVYDLPMAVALLMADGSIAPSKAVHSSSASLTSSAASSSHTRSVAERSQVSVSPTVNVDDFLIAGELALDGRVRPIKGVISLAILAKQRGMRGVIVPADNAAEAAAVADLDVLGVATLGEVVGLLNGTLAPNPHPTIDAETMIAESVADIDFGDVRGQEAAKRAMLIAAAGNHNVVMIGPAGTGKTMMARALAGVLPPLTREEALEVTRIYSSVGLITRGQSLITRRPVRTPHHTASSAAIVGGGVIPRPGDVSLAHRGVLFLDEMPEFARSVLETLRQPMEDGVVTIARAHGSLKFPARFMLVAAMNPTHKGDMARDDTSQREMDRYLSKLSGPLIDRIDIHVEVPAVPFKQLAAPPVGTNSAAIRQRVLAARSVQRERQGPMRTNAELSGKMLDKHAALDEAARTLLGQAMTELGLSARAYDKVRRIARTIADLEGAEHVDVNHVAEAVQYRLLDRKK